MEKVSQKEGEILDIGSEVDIVQKSGSWFSYNEERLGQGRENAKIFLKENPEIREEIRKRIIDLKYSDNNSNNNGIDNHSENENQ